MPTQLTLFPDPPPPRPHRYPITSAGRAGLSEPAATPPRPDPRQDPRYTPGSGKRPPPSVRRPRDGRGRHENSLQGYHERIAKSPAISGRRADIYAWLLQHGPATDREVAQGLFGQWADLNMVRPRITELLNDGHLAEQDHVTDPATGMTVRRVAIATQEHPHS